MQKADVSWYPIPKGHDICPVCNGTSVRELSEAERSYSWNKGRTHSQCLNCGGQDMGGKAHGYVKIDPATGKGCKHTFSGRNSGRCLTTYTCNKCLTSYQIDSSD